MKRSPQDELARLRKFRGTKPRELSIGDEVERVHKQAARRAGAIPGRKRPQNDTNLAEALAKVLKGKTMRVRDMVGAVQRAGYRTSAENFRTIVNQALIKNKTLFKKMGRGQYTAA